MGIEYTIRPFKGDTGPLADMIYDSWLADVEKSSVFRRYDKDWLDWTFNAPDQEPNLINAAYVDDVPVGFLVLLNRHIVFRGQTEANSLLGTLMTVHKDYRSEGIGWRLVQHAIDQVMSGNVKDNYSVLLGFIQPQRGTAPLLAKVIDSCLPGDASSKNVLTVQHQVKILRPEIVSEASKLDFINDKVLDEKVPIPDHPVSGSVEPMRSSDVHDIMDMLNGLSDRADLARVWDEESLKWQLNHAPVAKTFVLRDRFGIQGAVNYHRIEMCDGGELFPVAEIDNLLLPDEHDEARGFMSEVLRKLRDDEGVSAVVIADTGYFDRSALWEVGFLEYPRPVNLMGHSFAPGIDLGRVHSVYLDFR